MADEEINQTNFNEEKKDIQNKSEIQNNFLITGSTDGIGLLTAKMLAKTAPEVKKDDNRKRQIFIHGRSEDRIANAKKDI